MNITRERPAFSSAVYSRIRALDRQWQMAIDLAILIAAFGAAYLLRFDFRVPSSYGTAFLIQLPIVLLAQVLAAYFTGIYSFIWRFVGLTEVKAFLRAAAFALLPLLALRLGLGDGMRDWKPPLSVIFIDNFLAFGGMLAVRVVRRVMHERRTAVRQARGRTESSRVLILGAGHTGLTIARETTSRGDTGLLAVGFLDDDPAKLGSVISGIKVLGTTEDLAQVVNDHAVDQVILAMAAAPSGTVRSIVDTCEELPIPLRVVPPLAQILDGSVAISRLRPVEIQDLLGRDPVSLDQERLRGFLHGKRVMVTGAGGSIGSEISRQILEFEPSQLLLVERAEFPLFNLLKEFDQHRSTRPRPITPLVADAGDEARMRSILAAHRPQVIIHAAAHKHVPLMELNACEAVANNLGTTDTIAKLANQFECETFVLISTDKAVRPASIMGATKRAAEMLILDYNRESTTRYVAVRFGNVLGSTGSVIPTFEQQIRDGGPVTVTHPEMSRYFMTIQEASQLVLQAGSFGRGGEILILDMGEPVSIVRLAEDMIRLSGFSPYQDIEIVFTGVRPGEKVAEELSLDPSELERTQHPKIFVSSPLQTEERLREKIREILEIASMGLEKEVRIGLAQLISEATLATERPSLRQRSQSARPAD